MQCQRLQHRHPLSGDLKPAPAQECRVVKLIFRIHDSRLSQYLESVNLSW